MMKFIMLLICVIILQSLYSQQLLPRTIIIEYSDGSVAGSVSDKIIVRSSLDSVRYIQSSESKNYYKSGNMFYRRKKVNLYDDKVELSECPYYSVDNYQEIKNENVYRLVSLLDTSKLVIYTMHDSIRFTGWKQKSDVIQAFYKLSSFSASNYGLDDKYFTCFCEYYKSAIKNKEPNFKLDFDCSDTSKINQFLLSRMRNLDGGGTTKSHQRTAIDLIFDNYQISIVLMNVGGFHTSWNYYINGERLKYELLAPEINQAVYNIYPDGLRGKQLLIEYKDPYLLYRKILTGW